MYFEQFYLGCLAHASYLLASGDEAVVVDPQRDVDLYLKAADAQGVKSATSSKLICTRILFLDIESLRLGLARKSISEPARALIFRTCP